MDIKPVAVAALLLAVAAFGQLHDTPEPGTGPEGGCPGATNYEECLVRCDCAYSKKTSKCGTNNTCWSIALSEQQSCYANCADTYGDPSF